MKRITKNIRHDAFMASLILKYTGKQKEIEAISNDLLRIFIRNGFTPLPERGAFLVAKYIEEIKRWRCAGLESGKKRVDLLDLGGLWETDFEQFFEITNFDFDKERNLYFIRVEKQVALIISHGKEDGDLYTFIQGYMEKIKAFNEEKDAKKWAWYKKILSWYPWFCRP